LFSIILQPRRAMAGVKRKQVSFTQTITWSEDDEAEDEGEGLVDGQGGGAAQDAGGGGGLGGGGGITSPPSPPAGAQGGTHY
jgi:hypothetical protein